MEPSDALASAASTARPRTFTSEPEGGVTLISVPSGGGVGAGRVDERPHLVHQFLLVVEGHDLDAERQERRIADLARFGVRFDDGLREVGREEGQNPLDPLLRQEALLRTGPEARSRDRRGLPDRGSSRCTPPASSTRSRYPFIHSTTSGSEMSSASIATST